MQKITMVVVLFFLLVAVSAGDYCYSQDSQEQVMTVRGKVKDVSWVADRLVINNPTFGGSDEITFLVPHGTKITRGGSQIGLSEVNIADNVTVEYVNSLAGLKVLHIIVKR